MKNKLWIATLIIGAILGYLLTPSSVPEPTVEQIETIVYISDTVYVEIEPEIIEPSKPDIVEETAKGLIRSTKTFETKFADIKVTALAECPVILFTLDLENIKPMKVEIQHELRTVEKLTTIVIKPKWYEPNAVGIVIGVVGTLALVYATGQLIGDK